MAEKNAAGFNFIHAFLLVIAVLVGGGFGIKWFKAYQKRTAAEAEAKRVAALRVSLNADKAKVVEVLRKWDDALKLANMTSRIALAQPVSQMQAVRREMDDLRTNLCFDKATKEMVDAMNEGLLAFESFAINASGSGLDSMIHFQRMNNTFGTANASLAACYPPSSAASATGA